MALFLGHRKSTVPSGFSAFPPPGYLHSFPQICVAEAKYFLVGIAASLAGRVRPLKLQLPFQASLRRPFQIDIRSIDRWDLCTCPRRAAIDIHPTHRPTAPSLPLQSTHPLPSPSFLSATLAPLPPEYQAKIFPQKLT